MDEIKCRTERQARKVLCVITWNTRMGDLWNNSSAPYNNKNVTTPTPIVLVQPLNNFKIVLCLITAAIVCRYVCVCVCVDDCVLLM